MITMYQNLRNWSNYSRLQGLSADQNVITVIYVDIISGYKLKLEGPIAKLTFDKIYSRLQGFSADQNVITVIYVDIILG